MAITVVDYWLWQQLRDAKLVPDRPNVLEFGQANWYGDVDPQQICEVINKYAEPSGASAFTEQLKRGILDGDLFAIGRSFYGAVLRYESIVAIDLNSPDCAIKSDLNEPLDLPLSHFDILINSGTAEHVFDQRQLWKSAHDHVKVGALMVHALPLWGWLDHGFVNYHPTFVADVATANEYEIVKWVFAELNTGRVADVNCPDDFRDIAQRFGTGVSAMMYVVFRKRGNDEFRVPMQGYYDGRLNDQQRRAWKEDR